MFYIKICDLIVKIEHRYDFVYHQCEDYRVDSENDEYNFSVSVTDEQIKREHENSEIDAPLGYCESVCLYREISFKMLDYDAFLFHSAVIDVDGKSYAFAASSGTGKSTHINLWLQHFKDRATVVNGDKPLLRFCGDTLFAYGTPWCGKERLQTNICSPLKAICFLQRSETNQIRKIDEKQVVNLLFQQTILPSDPEKLTLLFDMLGKMVRTIPCYLLECNISDEAVNVAFEGMQ